MHSKYGSLDDSSSDEDEQKEKDQVAASQEADLNTSDDDEEKMLSLRADSGLMAGNVVLLLGAPKSGKSFLLQGEFSKSDSFII